MLRDERPQLAICSRRLEHFSTPPLTHVAGPLVRHEYGQGRAGEDLAGGAAEDHLPDAALRVGTLEKQIAFKLGRFFENGEAGLAPMRRHGEFSSVDAMVIEIIAHRLSVRAGYSDAFDS